MKQVKFNENGYNCYNFGWMRYLIMLLFIAICVGACNTQSNKSPHDLPRLPKLEAAKHHYAQLQMLPDTPQDELKELDEVFFPDQVNKILLMAINPTYISKEELNKLVPTLKHPANSSKQVRAELDFLVDLQNSRTKSEVEESLRLHEIGYFPVVGMKSDKDLFVEAFEIFGKEFDPDNYPETRKLLHEIMKEMRVMEFAAKNTILRPRPRQLESKLKPLKKMKSSSFASGHTLWAYMHAFIFASLVPEKETEFIDLAYKIGYTREILGVHYPSDEEAARNLAHSLLNLMWENAEFQNQLKLAALEWDTTK